MDDMSRTTELYITGLKNAHAMETQALSIMKPQAERIETYPEVEAQLRKHIAETEAQIDRLESLLADSGASQSMLKDTAMSMAGGMAAIGHSIAGDEILKNSIADFAFENYEIAAYKSLITLASAAGQTQAMTLLEESLAEEQAMASWLENNLEALTLKFASLSAAGAEAKK